jgi:hypothetical protein
MNGYRFRVMQGTYKPRSQAGLGMGSHSSIQRLVGRLIQPVQIADERMDSVQAGSARGCLLSGGWKVQHICGAPAIRLRLAGHRNRYPLPPAPHGSEWGPIQNFPLFFPDKANPFF